MQVRAALLLARSAMLMSALADSQMRSPAFALKTGFAPNVPLSAAPGAAPRDADAAALPIPGRETAVVAPVPARRFIPPATPLTPSLASVYAQMQGAAPARRGAAA